MRKTIREMKLMIFTSVIACLLMSCNTANQNNRTTDIPPADSAKHLLTQSGLATSDLDNLSNSVTDTTTLLGKRRWILNTFLLQNLANSAVYDTLLDLNFDGHQDYIIGYYGQSGTGLKNFVKVFLYDPNLNAYVFNQQLSNLTNPTFYLNKKKITAFYLGNGGGEGTKLEWIDHKWVTTKEFAVNFDHNKPEKTTWKIKDPLTKETKVIIRPYQMIPPHDILECDQKY